MKRTSFISLLTVLFILVLPACQEDEWTDWKLQNEQWLAVHKNDPGFIETESGLCYKVIYPGWSYAGKPNQTSRIIVNYKGTLIDGSVFDSIATGKNAALWLSQTIPAWQEALPKVFDDAILKIYVPSKLGYDTASSYVKIPPHSVLIFDITLNDFYNNF